MSVETWGELNKSQIDSEKIEAAIARLIAAHEADPDSHLGEGEALQSHRASEIIDHAVGSVVADKMQTGGYYLLTTFENLSLWSITGSVNQYWWPGLEMYGDTGTPLRARIEDIGSNVRNFIDYNRDFLIQFSFSLASESSPSAYFAFGNISTHVFTRGISLELTPASDKIHWKTDLTDYYSSDLSISRAEHHTFRMNYIASEAKLYCYLDSVLVATIDKPSGANPSGANQIMIDLVDGGTGESAMIMEYLLISRGD